MPKKSIKKTKDIYNEIINKNKLIQDGRLSPEIDRKLRAGEVTYESIGSLGSGDTQFLVCTRDNIAYFIYVITGKSKWQVALTPDYSKNVAHALNLAADTIDISPNLPEELPKSDSEDKTIYRQFLNIDLNNYQLRVCMMEGSLAIMQTDNDKCLFQFKFGSIEARALSTFLIKAVEKIEQKYGRQKVKTND